MNSEQVPTKSTTESPTAPVAPASADSQNYPTTTIDQHIIMGILCYIGPLVLIPLIMAKDTPGVGFHVKQGLVLFGIELVVMVGGNFLLMITMGLMYPVIMLLNFALLILSALGIYHVIKKQEKELPVVGRYANMISL